MIRRRLCCIQLQQLQLSDKAGSPDTNVTPFIMVHGLLTTTVQIGDLQAQILVIKMTEQQKEFKA